MAFRISAPHSGHHGLFDPRGHSSFGWLRALRLWLPHGAFRLARRRRVQHSSRRRESPRPQFLRNPNKVLHFRLCLRHLFGSRCRTTTCPARRRARLHLRLRRHLLRGSSPTRLSASSWRGVRVAIPGVLATGSGSADWSERLLYVKRFIMRFRSSNTNGSIYG